MKKILIIGLILISLFVSVSCDNQEAIDKAVAEATAKANAAAEAKANEKEAAYQNYVDFAESYNAKEDLYSFVYRMVAYDWSEFNGDEDDVPTRDATAVTDEGVISKEFSESDLSSVKNYISYYSQQGLKDILINLFDDDTKQKATITDVTAVSGKVTGHTKTYTDDDGNYVDDYELVIENLEIKFKYKLQIDGKSVKDETTSSAKVFDDGVLKISGTIKQKCEGETYYNQFTVKSVTSTTSALKLQEKSFKDITADYDRVYSRFTSAKVGETEVDLTYIKNQLY